MKRWASEDEDYLKHNYKNMTNKELSESLGRSVNSIMGKKNKLGLRNIKKHPTITNGVAFGDWIVKSFSHVDKKGNSYYQCQCSCGNIKNIRGTELKSGGSASCGGSKHFDLTNSVFGELTVLRLSHIDSNRKSYYKCMCSCGYISIVRGDSLTQGLTRSCGRSEHSDLTGLSFSNWKVLSISYTDEHSNVYYTCKCSCGTIKDVRGKHLLSGASASCGCSTEYKGEVRIRQYFESRPEFVYKEQVEYEGLRSKDGKRNLISDGALYDNHGNLMLMIEYDGIQHYEYRPFFHRSKKDFDGQVRRDRLKDEYCFKNGISLLRISCWDYDNVESILNNYIKKQGEIHLTRKDFYWLTENSRLFLSRGYLLEGQEPEERMKDIAQTAEDILGIKGFADKFYDYLAKGYYSLSTPVWTNFGIPNRGLPISCFGSNVADSMSNILYTAGEVGMMSKYGGGTSGYFGHLRPRGADITNNGQSSGSVHAMKLFEQITDTVSQGNTRRGRFAPYLPIDHPDIMEFLDIGTEGNDIQDVNHGVTVTDDWLIEMIGGDKDKRAVWAKVLQRRVEMGYPYIFYTDTVNNNKPEWFKDLPITHSNLCSEIMLPNNEEWSFVCNLSSMNAVHFDEWKDTDAVETMTYFLDAVMSEFITKLENLRDSEGLEERDSFKFMERAYNFAVDNRALGIGVLGWHSLLQSQMIPFESVEASLLNEDLFKTIREKAEKASEELAKKFGEPKVTKGFGRRNATLMAVAPTTSSAFIVGQTSQSIEPLWSNTYVKDVAKAKVTVQNEYLKDVLKKYDKDTRETWTDILNHDGSVQHLEYLTDNERDVFKTFSELNQYEIINQASIRQKYIDQGQSLNIMVNPTTSAKELNDLHLYAWEQGIKTLYYQHGTNAAQKLFQSNVCLACEA